MNLEQRISQYRPSPDTVELIKQTKIVLLVGISGAGKDTIKKQLIEQPEYRDIVSHTTRPPRSNNDVVEVEGLDYHFIDEAAVNTMLDTNAFIEAKFVHGTVYGTSVQEVKVAHDNHQIAITDLDVQGVDEYKHFSSDVVAIFILPPSYVVWRERLQQRYATLEEFEQEWPKRRDSAIQELTKALALPYYHFIINDVLDHTVQIADEIAHQPDVFHRKDDEARLAARDLLDEIVRHN